MEFELIQDVELLQAYCSSMATQEWLVLDTEFIREKTYFPNLCLIQIANQERAACIDTLAIEDLSALRQLVNSQSTIKIFHAASQDLEIFFNLFGEIPTPLFDTQIAASALGYGDQVSYAHLVNKICGITIDKSLSRTAWDRRPLTAKEMQYAIDDVKFLAEIYLHLKNELKQKQRDHWLDDEFQRMSDINRYNVTPSKLWKSVKGVGKLSPHQLIVLKFLAEWRNKQAKQENKPLQWILRDKSLRVLSFEQPTSVLELSKIEEVTQAQCANYADAIIECIKNARQTPERHWPEASQIAPLNREQRKLAKSALQLIRDRAEELDIAPNLLATRSIVEKLIRGNRDLQILKGWRQDLVGNDLVKLLEEYGTI